MDFTNPTGLVTQALLDQGHRAIGLCNVAIGFQREFAERFGVEPERVQLDHVGLNHLTWERKVLVDGVDRLPELLDAADRVAAAPTSTRSTRRSRSSSSARSARSPASYLHYYYRHRARARSSSARAGQPRAEEVMEIEAGLLELYRDPTLDTKPEAPRGAGRGVLQRRGRGAGRVAARGHRRRAGRERAQRRRDPEPARRRRRRGLGSRSIADGAHPLADRPARARDARARAAREGVRAARDRARRSPAAGRAALKALMTNPLVGDYRPRRPLLDALLDANERHLRGSSRAEGRRQRRPRSHRSAARRRAAGSSRAPPRRRRPLGRRRGRRSP